MKNPRPFLLASLLVAAFGGSASASPVIDFSSLGSPGTVTPLTNPKTLDQVTATGYYWNGSSWTTSNATLIARADADDHGLGICSPNETCNGGGDYNELSQLENNEALLLSLQSGWSWTSLWVSSLDSGGTNNQETGSVCWGSTSAIDTLLGGSCFDFKYGDFGTSVEGDLFTLSAFTSLFNVNATYVLFVPNGDPGTNNDYLVYGASVTQPELDRSPVPEPASLTLLGLGLGGVRLLTRRRRRQG